MKGGADDTGEKRCHHRWRPEMKKERQLKEKKNRSRKGKQERGEEDPDLQAQRGWWVRPTVPTSWQADEDLGVGLTLIEDSTSTTATKPQKGLHRR
jgi:hypothetical protein